MSRMADVSVGKRLSLLVGVALLVLAFTVIGGVTATTMISDRAGEMQALERTTAGLNHLDTRESELKTEILQRLGAQVVQSPAGAVQPAAGSGKRVVEHGVDFGLTFRQHSFEGFKVDRDAAERVGEHQRRALAGDLR